MFSVLYSGRDATLFQRKRYPNYRSVTSMEKSASSLLIKIDAVSNRGFYAVGLTIVSGVFLSACWIIAVAFSKVRTLAEAVAVLPAPVFMFVWCMVGSRFILERLSVVELSVGRGIFRWRYQIWRWSRDIEARRDDVTAVEGKVRWYGNRLIVMMNGKTYSLGGLLDDDVEKVARELRRELPQARRLADTAG
jgi:hypothetical protein